MKGEECRKAEAILKVPEREKYRDPKSIKGVRQTGCVREQVIVSVRAPIAPGKCVCPFE